jgi:predicted patatin/cPLA2 family phospholipase
MFSGGIVGSSGGAWNCAYYIGGKDSTNRGADIYTPHKEYFIDKKPYPKLDLDWLCHLSTQEKYFLDLDKINYFSRSFGVVVAKHDSPYDAINRIRILFPADMVTESNRKLEIIKDCIKASSALQYAYNKTVRIGKNDYWDIRPYEIIPIKQVVSNPMFSCAENIVIISSYKFPKTLNEVISKVLTLEQVKQAEEIGIPLSMVDPSFSSQKLWETYQFMRDDNLRNYTILEPCDIPMTNGETDHVKIRHVIDTSKQEMLEKFKEIKNKITNQAF